MQIHIKVSENHYFQLSLNPLLRLDLFYQFISTNVNIFFA